MKLNSKKSLESLLSLPSFFGYLGKGTKDTAEHVIMNKIFIYARPCVNKMTCSSVFFVPFPKYPKIDGNDKKLSGLFWEFSFVLATQSNSKSGEDVSQIIKPE